MGSVRFRPIADICPIRDADQVIRAEPSALIRICAALGAALWAFAALYSFIVILSGFVSWSAPNVYITGLLVLAGLVVNVLLFRRAEKLKPVGKTALVIVSLGLSGMVFGTLIHIAFDLGS